MDEHIQVTQEQTPMGWFTHVAHWFLVAFVLVCLSAANYATVSWVLDQVEDRCIVGFCVDRQPQAP